MAYGTPERRLNDNKDNGAVKRSAPVGLYFYKEIPFKASLYALYVVIAVFGYIKWKKIMRA